MQLSTYPRFAALSILSTMSTVSTITIMTADVVDGWQKLPNELKLIILRYALPSGETFGWLSFNKTQLHQTYSQYTNGCKTPSTSLIARMAEVRRCETNVLPLMACPVIGALIPEAFYTQNVFKILILPGEVSSEVVLPPVLVGKAMRHVKIGVQCPHAEAPGYMCTSPTEFAYTCCGDYR
jgi:hypothetical protein